MNDQKGDVERATVDLTITLLLSAPLSSSLSLSPALRSGRTRGVVQSSPARVGSPRAEEVSLLLVSHGEQLQSGQGKSVDVIYRSIYNFETLADVCSAAARVLSR